MTISGEETRSRIWNAYYDAKYEYDIALTEIKSARDRLAASKRELLRAEAEATKHNVELGVPDVVDRERSLYDRET